MTARDELPRNSGGVETVVDRAGRMERAGGRDAETPRSVPLNAEKAMLHVVHMIQRRYPDRARMITRSLVLASASALLAGIGLLMLG